MSRRVFALTLVVLVSLSAMLPIGLIPRAHGASSGLICIAQTTDSMCGASPIFNGPVTNPNSLLRVPIFINDTDPFVGFDISVNSSDTSKLRPFGADLTGSMMPSSSIVLSECIGGFNVTGSICPSYATSSTVRLAAIGPFGFLSVPGATGLLFTAIFEIVGTTPPGGISVNFQTGCSGTSVPGECITVTNGTVSPVPESTQDAGFDNSDTSMLPYATLSTQSTTLGTSLAGQPTFIPPAVTFTATSQNGFNTTSNAGLALSVSFNGTGARPTATLSPAAIDLTGVASQTFTQNSAVPSTVKPGVYSATVMATYTSQDLLTFTTSSLAALYQLPVRVVDYTLAVSPNPVTIQAGSSQPVAVTISPKSGFDTLVKLGVSIPPATASAGITARLSTNTISGGAGTAILNVTASPTSPHGPFTLTIASNSTLNGFTKIHAMALVINPSGPDFGITANPSSITLPSPVNSTSTQFSTVTLTSINFTGFVQLITSVAPQGLSVSLGSSALFLRPNSQNSTSLTPLASASTPPGTYKVTVIGVAGLLSRNVNVTVTVPAPPPGDFTLSANPSLLTLPAASTTSAQSTITATSLNGFSGNLTLSATSDIGFSGSITLVLNPSRISFGPSLPASSILTVTTSNVSPGTYHVTVVGRVIPFSHSVTITVQVVPAPSDFQIIVPQGGISLLAGTSTTLGVDVISIGPSLFTGTVTLSGQIVPFVPNGPLFSFDRVEVIPGQYGDFSDLTISTTALTPPGNYTITVQGVSGSLVHTASFRFTVLPPPILTASPSSGPVGTQVTLRGTGFLFPSGGPFASPIELEMTFDDQLVGFVFFQGSSFNFTFNVPVSQAGQLHQIHAKTFYPGLDVQTIFLVTAQLSAVNVSVSAGTIYFQGDTSVIFVTTSLNGQAITVSSLRILLVRPDGSNVSLNTIPISTGYYRATYPIPSSAGVFGTYAVVVTAKQTGGSAQSTITTFEVKPTWLQSHGQNIQTGAALAGVVGAFGMVGLAWRKGYFTRKSDDFSGL